MAPRELEPRTVRAKELYGDYWFNSEPVPVTALRGSVILLLFWDYACSGSLRVLPYVGEWYRRYRAHGLTVVGVQTPKYPFGKDPQHVEEAIARLGIAYPVVLDGSAQIWSRYGVRVWPTVVLIDKSGFLRFIQEGEGNPLPTEREIQMLLQEGNLLEDLPELMEPIRDTDRPGAVCFRATRELFGGYVRGSVGNVEPGVPESAARYEDPGIYLDGRFYLGGEWRSTRDTCRSEADNDHEGQIILRYSAAGVSGVFDYHGRGTVELAVEQDDRSLTETNRGDDVRIAAGGRSVLTVQGARLYSIVNNQEHGEHLLRLKTVNDGLEVYSFSFISGVIPELISDN